MVTILGRTDTHSDLQDTATVIQWISSSRSVVNGLSMNFWPDMAECGLSQNHPTRYVVL